MRKLKIALLFSFVFPQVAFADCFSCRTLHPVEVTQKNGTIKKGYRSVAPSDISATAIYTKGKLLLHTKFKKHSKFASTLSKKSAVVTIPWNSIASITPDTKKSIIPDLYTEVSIISDASFELLQGKKKTLVFLANDCANRYMDLFIICETSNPSCFKVEKNQQLNHIDIKKLKSDKSCKTYLKELIKMKIYPYQIYQAG